MRNNIIKVLFMFVISLMTVSCSDDDEVVVKSLEVNPITLHGQWKLQEVNGSEIPSDIYVYIDFKRQDKTFNLYQKQDSQLPRKITGKFDVEYDYNIGYILSGTYDYEQGAWNNKYIVTDLLEEGSMIWTVKDGDEISKYVRVDEIPSEILGDEDSEK